MTKEQVQNIQDAKREAESSEADGETRERSTIQFPYNDLDEAVAVAKAIHENAGVSCTIDQLAAYMKQSMTSGAFRLRVSNAAIFGLTDNERGQVRLTSLGRQIADPSQEAAARAESFMRVPLYARVFENYKGFTLPGPAALEKFMLEVGVSSKQTAKARHAFSRSAKQAGYFEHGEDRLVRPAALTGPGTKPIEPEAPKAPESEKKGGSGGGDFGSLHPFIQGLLKTLPEPETEWASPARVKWLQTAANIFDLIYKGDGGGISVTGARADRSPRPNE
jgi:hypothetical protein